MATTAARMEGSSRDNVTPSADCWGPHSASLPRPPTLRIESAREPRSYRASQHLDIRPPSVTNEHRRVRRKPSVADLVASRQADLFLQVSSSEDLPLLSPSLPTPPRSASASIPSPTTPLFWPEGHFRSRDSTEITFIDAPCPEPYTGGQIPDPWTLPGRALTTKVSTKRHFGNIRQAKRLPHYIEDPWEVHAVIGISDGERASEQLEDELEIEGRLGGFKGNLGDYSQVPSPATLHYRGASFDVVNPHASLLLASQQFETPAEIDGLLEDYFSSEMRYDNLTGEMSSPTSSVDNSRPSRPLFDDAVAARRGIMGLGHEPAKLSASPDNVQDAALAGDSTSVASEDENTQVARHIAQENSTVGRILDDYDYTREPSSDGDLHALIGGNRSRDTAVSGSSGDSYMEMLTRAPPDMPLHQWVFTRNHPHAPPPRSRQPPPLSGPYATNDKTQGAHHHLGAVDTGSEHPTSERTYGDTNQLLQIPIQESQFLQQHNPQLDKFDISVKRLQKSPRVTSSQVDIDVEQSTHSACASLHDGDSSENGVEKGRAVKPSEQGHTAQIPKMWSDCDMNRSRTNSNLACAAPLHNPFEHSSALEAQDEGDWVTLPSDRHSDPFVSDALRHSVGSYADMSDYSGMRPLSTISCPEHEQQELDELRPDGSKKPKSAAQQHDEQVALQALQQILSTNGLSPAPANHRQCAMTTAEVDLEKIRRHNPPAVQQAVDLMLENRRELNRPERRSSFELLGVTPSPQHYNSYSDMRGLISRTRKNFSRRNLDFSTSSNTFGTSPTQDEDYQRFADDGEADTPWSPISPPAPARIASTRLQPMSDKARGKQPMADSAPKRIRRAAMSSQTGLRDLGLTATPTSNIRAVLDSPELHRGRRAAANAVPYPYKDRSLMFQPRPILTVRNALLRPEEVMDPMTLRLEDKWSSYWFWRLVWFPPCAMLYSLGHYDYLIERKTAGRVKAMDKQKKEDAAYFAFLGFIFYAIIVVAGVIVAVLKTK